jgi:hypothetical protein
MECSFDERNHHEDKIDREFRTLLEELEEEERHRRAVIDLLVMMGDDQALAHDV